MYRGFNGFTRVTGGITMVVGFCGDRGWGTGCMSGGWREMIRDGI